MKERLKNGIIFLGILAMIFGNMTLPVQAADSDYVVIGGVLADYNGSGSKLEIPEGVTSIDDEFFDINRDELKQIKEIYLPASFKSIKGLYLSAYENLESITVHKDNKYFSSENGVLYNKDKTQLIKYPIKKQDKEFTTSSKTKILAAQAIQGNKYLQKLTLGMAVTTINNESISNCANLKSITLSKSVKTINANGILYNQKLAEIKVNSQNKYFTDVNGVLFNKKKTILVKYPENKKGTKYIIPSTVTTIGYRAFSRNENLEKVTLGKKVKIVKGKAFYICKNLKEVVTNDALTSIGNFSFASSGKLQKITFKKGLKKIGNNAFSDCVSLKNVTFKADLKTLGSNVFKGCTSLKQVSMPVSAKTATTINNTGKNIIKITVNSKNIILNF